MSIKIMQIKQLSIFSVLIFIFLFFPGQKLFSKELAKFNDWTAFAEGEGKNLACMAVSKPKKSEGDYTKRGDIFAIVTHLPGQKKWNEFSVVAGYNYKTNSNPDIFLDKEIEIRKKNNLPPFQRFISIILSSEDEKILDEESLKLQKVLKRNLKAEILGPVNAPIYKIKKKYRNRLLIRASKSYRIQKFLAKTLNDFKFSKKIKLSVDVDPISFN